MQRVEALIAAFAQYPDRVDHDVDVLHGAHPVGRAERTREIARQMLDGPGRRRLMPPRDRDDTVAPPQQRFKQTTPDETGSTSKEDSHATTSRGDTRFRAAKWLPLF